MHLYTYMQMLKQKIVIFEQLFSWEVTAEIAVNQETPEMEIIKK